MSSPLSHLPHQNTTGDEDNQDDQKKQASHTSLGYGISDIAGNAVNSTISKVLNSIKHNKLALEIKNNKKGKIEEEDETFLADTAPPIITTVKFNCVNFANTHVHILGCCGLGHRLLDTIPALVYANRQGRMAKVV